MTQRTKPEPSPTNQRTLWLWGIVIFAAAVAATAYVTQAPPWSKTVILLIGTTYGTYLAVNYAIAIPALLKTPGMLQCRKHWRYRMPDSFRWIARIATIVCPNLPYWATSIAATGNPRFITILVATAAFTAVFAVIMTHFQTKTMRQQLYLHQQDDCSSYAPPDNVVTLPSAAPDQPTA